MKKSKRPASQTFTIKLAAGPIETNLFAVDTGVPKVDGRGRYVVGLRVLEEPQQMQQPSVGSDELEFLHSKSNQEPLAMRVSTGGKPTQRCIGNGQLPGMINPETSTSASSTVPEKSGVARSIATTGASESWTQVLPSEHSGRRDGRDDFVTLECVSEEFGQIDVLRKPSDVYAKPSKTMHSQIVQTEGLKMSEIGVNTTIVMDGLGIRCVNCTQTTSRSPKPPSFTNPNGMPPKVVRNPTQAKSQAWEEDISIVEALASTRRKYMSNSFDGRWVAKSSDGAPVSSWLSELAIDGSRVVLGDGDVVQIWREEDKGRPSLCDGEIFMKDKDTLIRVGHSGVEIEFERVRKPATIPEYMFGRSKSNL